MCASPRSCGGCRASRSASDSRCPPSCCCPFSASLDSACCSRYCFWPGPSSGPPEPRWRTLPRGLLPPPSPFPTMNPGALKCQVKEGPLSCSPSASQSRDPVTLPLCPQNILRQTEEGSSRQENAQKALGAVSKVGGRCWGWRRWGGGRERWKGWQQAGVGDSASLTQIIERCSAEVGRMKQTEELIRLTQRLRFHKVKVSPCPDSCLPLSIAKSEPPSLLPCRPCPWSPGRGAWSCRGS